MKGKIAKIRKGGDKDFIPSLSLGSKKSVKKQQRFSTQPASYYTYSSFRLFS